jgi:hypothetical protein
MNYELVKGSLRFKVNGVRSRIGKETQRLNKSFKKKFEHPCNQTTS